MVFVDASSLSTVYDVVFVVEGTANVGAYFDNLKSLYVVPTIEYFNGGQCEEIDYGCTANCTLYSLVTFHGSDRAPGSLSTCQEPMTSAFQFLQSLDRIDFSSGYGDSASHMAEGFSTALQLFDDLEKLRDPHTKTQKHCILVCNSAPYSLLSECCPTYTGFTTEHLVSLLADKSINFSIISPRKIPVLYKLFDMACADPALSSVNAKNYTTDSRHLVLLKGPQLTERPVSPSVTKTEPATDFKTNINNPVVAPNVNMVRNSGPAIPRNPVVFPPGSTVQGAVKDVKQITDAKARFTGPRAAGNATLGVPSTETIQPMLAGKLGGPRQPNTLPPGTMGMQNFGMVRQNAPVMPGAGVTPGIDNSTFTPDTLQPNALGVNIINPSQTLPETALVQQTEQQQQQQRVIWAGSLEWQEKPKAGDVGPRTTRTLPCQILVNMDETEINASNWLNRMTMNLIPSGLLSPLHGLFRNSRTVSFQFCKQDLDSLMSLHRVMASGFGGCIHIQPVNNTATSPNDVRVLMLLFSQRKLQFMGLIPTDQSRFVQGIRSVISKHKQQQDRIRNPTAGPSFSGSQPVNANPAASGQQVGFLCVLSSSFDIVALTIYLFIRKKDILC